MTPRSSRQNIFSNLLTITLCYLLAFPPQAYSQPTDENELNRTFNNPQNDIFDEFEQSSGSAPTDLNDVFQLSGQHLELLESEEVFSSKLLYEKHLKDNRSMNLHMLKKFSAQPVKSNKNSEEPFVFIKKMNNEIHEYQVTFQTDKARAIVKKKIYSSKPLYEISAGNDRVIADFMDFNNVVIRKGKNNQSLVIAKTKTSRNETVEIAKHRINLDSKHGEILDIAYDKEVVFIQTSSGSLLALYSPLLKDGAFDYSLPLIEIYSLTDTQTKLKDIELSLVSRPQKPFEYDYIASDAMIPKDRNSQVDQQEAKARFDSNFNFIASDLAIVGKNEKDENVLVALLDRRVSLSNMHFGMTVVSYLASIASGNINLSEHKDIQHKPELLKNFKHPVLSKAFYNLGSAYQKIIGTSDQLNHERQNPTFKDTFTSDEWEGGYKNLVELIEAKISTLKPKSKERQSLQSNIDNGDIRDNWKYLLSEKKAADKPTEKTGVFSRKSMMTLTKYLALGGAVVAAGSVATTGNATTWALHIAQHIYEWTPETLKRTPYRWHMLSAGVFLSMGIPLLQLIGWTTSQFLGGKRKGFDFKRAYGWLGTVAFARIVRMFYLPAIEKIFSNPTFIEAAANGVNPFDQIKHDSKIGKKLGLKKNNFFGLLLPTFGLGLTSNSIKEKYRKRFLKKKEILAEVKKQNLNAQSYATILSLFLIAADDKDLDVITAFTMLQKGELSEPVFADDMSEKEKAEKSKHFGKRWKTVAAQLLPVMEQLAQDNDLPHLSALNSEEFTEIYEKSRVVIESYKGSKLKSIGKKLLLKTTNLLRRKAMPFLATWGTAESKTLRQNLISQPLSDEAWRATRSDYFFCTWQQLLVGARADFNQPDFLGAQVNGSPWLGYANPANVADTAEQLFIHGISVPSRNLINYQAKGRMQEDRYEPFDLYQLDQKEVKQGFVSGFQEWQKGIVGVNQLAFYGDMLMKVMYTNRLKMIQSSMVFSGISRVLIAQKTLSTAVGGWAFSYGLAPLFAFVWPLVVIGNTQLEGSTAEQSKQLKDAQTILNQGIRLGNQDLMKKGRDRIRDLYSVLPKEAKEAINLAGILSNHGKEKSKSFLLADESWELVLDLWESVKTAKDSGVNFDDKENLDHENTLVIDVKEKYHALLENRISLGLSTDPNSIDELSPERLLEYTLQTPPFPTKHNHLIQELSTFLIGVIPSTYIGSYIFANSYREDLNWFIAAPSAFGITLGIYLTAWFGLKTIPKSVNTAVNGIAEKLRFRSKIESEKIALQKSIESNKKTREKIQNQCAVSFLDSK